MAITGDVLISLPVTSTLLLAGNGTSGGAHYLYYIAVLSILLSHGLFLLYLDYFWVCVSIDDTFRLSNLFIFFS